jgi:hypothetical protein
MNINENKKLINAFFFIEMCFIDYDNFFYKKNHASNKKKVFYQNKKEIHE